MLSGILWLDYEDEENEEHWKANVTRAIFRDGEIVLEFSGHDPDYGVFDGFCKLEGNGARYVGSGLLKAGNESTSASISANLEHDSNSISLLGSWQDVGDSSAYTLTVELEPANQSA